MPTIRKLTPGEIAARNAPHVLTRQQIAHEYDAMLAGFTPGEWGAGDLAEDDHRQPSTNASRPLRAVSTSMWSFQRTKGNLLRFIGEAIQPRSSAD